MKRMYFEGVGVRGPSLPRRCKILVARTVCSQSSMNSHRWAKPVKQWNQTTIRLFITFFFKNAYKQIKLKPKHQCLKSYLLPWPLHSPLWLWWCFHRWLSYNRNLPININVNYVKKETFAPCNFLTWCTDTRFCPVLNLCNINICYNH